ncbi:amino acid ABC transporter permease [Burkholderia sp. L27(2015)]|uniref:amino acid ABC transporter permease n=1 Tax=Burkholderia sp. L27(2015) TaxID=1641858 RepID=UPI00131C9A45|nr:amino acid ABC transporter permease [Burkholderia sp. L27(2015)]
MSDFTLWDIARGLLLSARWTIALSLVAFIGGGVVGLLVLLLRTGRGNALPAAARTYIELFQGTPLLMQLFIAFFGLSLLGVDTTPWSAASLALTLWASAFLAEIWRGCVDAVPRGQWEASSSLAMGYLQQMRHVVLPQAMRIAIAPTVGFSVQVIKGTALASIIGFMEISKAGTIITNATFKPFTVYAMVAALYFILCWPLSRLAKHLERKLNAAHHH